MYFIFSLIYYPNHPHFVTLPLLFLSFTILSLLSSHFHLTKSTLVTKDQFVKTSDRKARVQFDELVKTKESAAGELKRSVYNNYPCFISTSKEISSI